MLKQAPYRQAQCARKRWVRGSWRRRPGDLRGPGAQTPEPPAVGCGGHSGCSRQVTPHALGPRLKSVMGDVWGKWPQTLELGVADSGRPCEELRLCGKVCQECDAGSWRHKGRWCGTYCRGQACLMGYPERAPRLGLCAQASCTCHTTRAGQH